VQRHKLPGEELPLLNGHEAANIGVMKGADRRSLGFERCSFGRKEL